MSSYFTASSAICLKTVGWCSANVARIFRSSSMCFILRAFMSLLYVMPFMRDAAFIFTLHNARRTRFFLRLSLKRCTPACKRPSRAARSFDFLPQRNPFVCFKTFRRRFTEIVPRLTRVIILRHIAACKFFTKICKSDCTLFIQLRGPGFFCLKMILTRFAPQNFSGTRNLQTLCH